MKFTKFKKVVAILCFILLTFGTFGFIRYGRRLIPNMRSQSPMKGGFDQFQDGAWNMIADDEKETDGAFLPNGILQLKLANRHPKLAYRGVRSSREINFTGQTWKTKIELSETNLQEGMEIKFRITKSHYTDFQSMQIQADGLHLVSSVDRNITDKIIPFDKANDQWFQFRHNIADNTIHFEKSKDGINWNEVWVRPVAFDITEVNVEIYAGTFLPVENPGIVKFSKCC